MANGAQPARDARTRLSAVAFAALLVAGESGGRAAATQTGAGIAYDQIELAYYLSGPNVKPPAPGSFDAVLALLGTQVAPATDPSLTSGPPLDSAFDITRLQKGILLRYAFLDGRWRVDDPLTQRATIALPDENRVIVLDLAAKKYRIIEGLEAAVILRPDGPEMRAALAKAMQTSSTQPTVQAVSVSVAVTPLAPLSIDGATSQGSVTTVRTTAPANGACPLTDQTSTVTQYFDPGHYEPSIPLQGDAEMAMMGAASNPGCREHVSSSGNPPAEHRLALFTRADGSVLYAKGKPPLTSTTVIVRGHVRDLTEADLTLFAVPPDFTLQASPRTPPGRR